MCTGQLFGEKKLKIKNAKKKTTTIKSNQFYSILFFDQGICLGVSELVSCKEFKTAGFVFRARWGQRLRGLLR